MTTAPSTAITKPGEKEPVILTLLKQPAYQQQLKKALPSQLGADRFIRMLITCVRANPGLSLCTQTSVLSGMFELAALGLEPNTPLGHAWLIPFNRGRGGKVAQVIIGYKGYIALGHRAAVTVWAEPVYDKDVFSYSLGSNPNIHHERSEMEDPGPLVRAYAVVQWPDGRKAFKIVLPSDIRRAKQASSAWRQGQQDKMKRDSPWYTDEPSMWAKTAVRRLVPFMPMTAELARAADLDQRADEGEEQDLILPAGMQTLLPPEDEASRLEREVMETKQAIQEQPEGAPEKPPMTYEQAADAKGNPWPPLEDKPKSATSTRDAIRAARGVE